MASVIELEQLSVTFGKRPILRSLNGVLNGRAIGLLGPNGAGKTTLIHTLLGFHPEPGQPHRPPKFVSNAAHFNERNRGQERTEED